MSSGQENVQWLSFRDALEAILFKRWVCGMTYLCEHAPQWTSKSAQYMVKSQKYEWMETII